MIHSTTDSDVLLHSLSQCLNARKQHWFLFRLLAFQRPNTLTSVRPSTFERFRMPSLYKRTLGNEVVDGPLYFVMLETVSLH